MHKKTCQTLMYTVYINNGGEIPMKDLSIHLVDILEQLVAIEKNELMEGREKLVAGLQAFGHKVDDKTGIFKLLGLTLSTTVKVVAFCIGRALAF